MLLRTTTIAAISALILAGCAQQEEAPGPIPLEPAYDKSGGIIGCVGGDGRVHELDVPGAAPADQRRDNPCDPPRECREGYFNPQTGEWTCRPPRGECRDGYFNQAGQWICRDDDDNGGGDDTPRGGREPQNPFGGSPVAGAN